jgi:hypothetical protein
MTMALSREDGSTSAGRATLPALSVASVLIVFAVLQAFVLRLTGGAFDYPLDDPYIHLAIAETIAGGGYGVNAGELSSPGSSPLFPLLLVPFSGTDLHRYLPLFWNAVGLALSAFLWGRLLFEAGFARPGWRALGIAAAILGPLAVMMPMVAFVGMEHALHAAATLALLLGLFRFLRDGSGGALILAGAFFGTAFRLEGLAPGLLAAAALLVIGNRKLGIATAAAALLPVAVFTGVLVALGMDPLPSSVQTKLAVGSAEGPGVLQERLAIFAINLMGPAGLFVGALTLGSFLLWRLNDRVKSSPWTPLVLVTVLAALAHLALGQMGWLNRYEHYILVLTAATFLVLLPIATGPRGPGPLAIGGVAALILGGALAYRLPMHAFELPPAARAIHTQQGQMARFAKEVLDTDVAVNDLGYVAWQNDNYVLDLWGLASAEARRIRLSDPGPGWTGDLTAKHDVPVAMVYDHWFEDGIGEDWVKLGDFHLTIEGGFLGGYAVAFYATAPAHVAMTTDAIAEWEKTLLPHSRFIWAEGMEP